MCLRRSDGAQDAQKPNRRKQEAEGDDGKTAPVNPRFEDAEFGPFGVIIDRDLASGRVLVGNTIRPCGRVRLVIRKRAPIADVLSAIDFVLVSDFCPKGRRR